MHSRNSKAHDFHGIQKNNKENKIHTHTIIRFRHGIFVVYVFFFEVEGKSEFHLAKWTCQLFDEDFFMNNVVKSNEDFKLDVAPIFLQFSSRSPPAATNWIEQFY